MARAANKKAANAKIQRQAASKIEKKVKTFQKQATASKPPPPTLPKPHSYSAAAASASSTPAATHAAPSSAPQNKWQVVGKKAAPRNSQKDQSNNLPSRQLVLTQGEQRAWNSLQLRNSFNSAFAAKGINEPVIASITQSKNHNIVVTTTPSFNASYLLDHQKVWEKIIPFVSALPIQPWFKVAIHNIPTEYFTNEDLVILKSEIPTFNKGLQIVGNPFWLTSEEKRRNQRTGSACIAFKTEQEALKAIRNRLYVLGISVRAEKLHSTPRSTQCQKCQKFGHTETRCQGNPTCKICGEAHPTGLHRCNTCGAKGRICSHTLLSCSNCKRAHTADNKTCEIYQATLLRSSQNPRAPSASAGPSQLSPNAPEEIQC